MAKLKTERTHLSVNPAAESIGVGEATVLAWIASGELKAINVGKGMMRPRWRILKADWSDCLDRRSNQQACDDKKPVKRSRPKPQRKYV